MALVVIALLAGLAVGYARGGGLSRLATIRPGRGRLLITGLGFYAAGVLVGWLWEPALAIFAGLAMLVWAHFAWLNRAIHGALLVAAGMAANAIVLLANGAVPVSADAALRAGADPGRVVSGAYQVQAGEDPRLAWLGKSVPVAFPPRPEVVSPGDVAIAAGLAVALCMGLTGRRASHPLRDSDDHLTDLELDDYQTSELVDHLAAEMDDHLTDELPGRETLDAPRMHVEHG